jgi:hypothetical protein
MTFFVNSHDANSWTDGATWIDVSGTPEPAVGRIPGLFGSACDCFLGSGECTPECPDSLLDLTGGQGGTTGQTVYNSIPSMPGMTVTSTQPVYNNQNYYYIPYLFDGQWGVNAHTTYYLAAGGTENTFTFDFGRVVSLTRAVLYPKCRGDSGAADFQLFSGNEALSERVSDPDAGAGTRYEIMIGRRLQQLSVQTWKTAGSYFGFAEISLYEAQTLDQTNHVFWSDRVPAYHEFAGTEHFEFSNPEYFDFPGDFTVSVMLRLPEPMDPFGVMLSRRVDSDYLMHHSVSFDRRTDSWSGCCADGLPRALMYMGGGDGDNSVWTTTGPLTTGEWNQITFTVTDGVICGYVNGYRSGDCSPTAMVYRQVGGLEPLEVGGEDSYTNHPLWSMASLMYYDRALTDSEVLANKQASNCIEMGIHPDASCPTDYIYDAGTTIAPINCLTGTPGAVEVQ